MNSWYARQTSYTAVPRVNIDRAAYIGYICVQASSTHKRHATLLANLPRIILTTPEEIEQFVASFKNPPWLYGVPSDKVSVVGRKPTLVDNLSHYVEVQYVGHGKINDHY